MTTQSSGDDRAPPLVTIIMPAFNAAETLAAAGRSVLAQTLTALELIIVDDGSSDGTFAVAQALAADEGRVRVLRHDTNSGSAAARNTALAAARGVWVAPVDADDELLEHRLAALVALGEAQTADVVTDNLLIEVAFNGRRHLEAAFAAPADPESYPLTAVDFLRSDLPANRQYSYGYLKPLIRRRFLLSEGLQYDERLRVCEDFHLYMRMLMLGARWVFDSRCGYVYCHAPDSLSRDPERAIRNLEVAVRCNRSLQAFARRRGRPDLRRLLRWHLSRLLAVLWVKRVKQMWAAGDLPTAVRAVALPLPNLVALAIFVWYRLASKLRPRASLSPQKR